MFGRLTDLINNVSKLDENKILINIISVDNIERYILDLNRIDQIFEDGVNAFGDSLGVYSARTEGDNEGRSFTVRNSDGNSTTREKKFGGQRFLYDTGEMFRSFDVVIDDGGFTITADTEKGEVNYEEKYRILGLTDESKSQLSKRILPMVVREVKLLLLS